VSREERLAAFRALAGFPPGPRRPYLERGLRSRDPEVRELCRRLGERAPARAADATLPPVPDARGRPEHGEGDA
jgi:hypothetical protein